MVERGHLFNFNPEFLHLCEKAIDEELGPIELEPWDDLEKRRAALEQFRRVLRGEDKPAKAAGLVQTIMRRALEEGKDLS